MLYRLIIMTGERRGEQITVTEEPMSIGRGIGCDVVISDPEMAQTHAQVSHQPGGPVIHDLGSMNRILVNNREVRQATLKHGDLVELGRTRLLVQAHVQAEVQEGLQAGGEESIWQRRWLWAAGAAVGVLLLVFVPLTCRHRPPAAPAAREVRHPAPRPAAVRPAEPGTREKPLPAPAVAAPSNPVPSNAVSTSIAAVVPATTAAPPAVVSVPAATNAASSGEVERITPAVQEEELELAAQAIAASKARTMLAEARQHADDGDLDGAERLLTEVLWLQPDAAPALELKARLLERRGRMDEARKQWGALAAVTNKEVAAQAEGEARRIDEERAKEREKEPPAVPARRVRISAADIAKFPETEAFREMRLLHVRLASADTNCLPDTGAVKVEVVFYERDRQTGAVSPAPARGPQDMIVAEGPWRPDEDKVVSASYTVPSAEPADRPDQFHGYVIRVFHHAVLQDAAAQPGDLLPGPESGPARKRGDSE